MDSGAMGGSKPKGERIADALERIAIEVTGPQFETSATTTINESLNAITISISDTLKDILPDWSSKSGLSDIDAQLEKITREDAVKLRAAAEIALDTLKDLTLPQSFPIALRARAEVLSSRLASIVRIAERVSQTPEVSAEEETNTEPKNRMEPQPEVSTPPLDKPKRRLLFPRKPREARAIDTDTGKRIESRKSPLLRRDPYYELLVELEVDGSKWDQLRGVVANHFRNLGELRGEKRHTMKNEVRRISGAIRRIEDRMSRASNEEIQSWASEVLDVVDNPLEDQPLLVLAEDNPFVGAFTAVRDSPLFSQALSDISEKTDQLMRSKKPRPAHRYNSLTSEAIHTMMPPATLAVTYMAWGFLSSGLSNILKAWGADSALLASSLETLQSTLAYMGAQINKDEGGFVRATFHSIPLPTGEMKLGQPIIIEFNRSLGASAANVTGGGIALLMTLLIAGHRHKPLREQSKLLWPLVLLSGGVGFTNIVEQAAQVERMGDYATQAGEAATQALPHVEQIPGLIENAEQSVIKSILIEALAESKKGGIGPRTIILLEATGIAGPAGRALLQDTPKNKVFFEKHFAEKDRAEMRSFLERVSDPSGLSLDPRLSRNPKLAADLKSYREALQRISKRERFAKLGFKDTAMALDVITSFFVPLLEAQATGRELTIKQEVLQIIAARHAAEGMNIWKQLAVSAHAELPFEMAGIMFAPSMDRLIDQVARVRGTLRARLVGYETIQKDRMADMQAFFAELAKETGVGQFQTFARAMSLPNLSTNSGVLENIFSNIHTPETELALNLLMPRKDAQGNSVDGPGWQLLTQSMKKGGVDFDLMTSGNGYGLDLSVDQKRWLFAFTLFLLYGGLIEVVLPDGAIKTTNRIRQFQFTRELRHRDETMNQMEDEIAEILTDSIEGFYQSSGVTNVVSSHKDFGTRIPRSLRVAFIRSRLTHLCNVRMSTKTDTEPEGARGLRGFLRFLASPAIESGKMLAQTYREELLTMEGVSDYERWRRAISLTVLTPLRAVTGAPFLGFKDTPDSVAESKEREMILSDILKSIRAGDTETIGALVSGIYPTFAPAVDAFSVSKMGTNEATRRDAKTVLAASVGRMNLEERAVLHPLVALELSILKQGRLTLTQALGPEDTVSDLVPFGVGQVHDIPRGYIGKRYMIARLDAEITDLEFELDQIRKDGLELEATLARGATPPTRRSQFELDLPTAELPDTSGIRKMLEAKMQERLDPVLKAGQVPRWRIFGRSQEVSIGPMTDGELADYFNEMNDKVLPLISRFQTMMNSGDPRFIRLSARGYALARGETEHGIPTVFLIATTQGSVDTRGNLLPGAEIQARIPYPGSIPDFTTGKSVEESLLDVESWLHADGAAYKTLDAQILYEETRRYMQEDIHALTEEFGSNDGPLRIPLDTNTIARIKNRNELSDTIIRIQRANIWKAEHQSTIARLKRGATMAPHELQSLSYSRVGPKSENVVDRQTYARMYDDLQQSLEALENVLSSDISVWLDPKSNPLSFILESRRSRTPERITLPCTEEKIRAAMSALSR